MLLRDLPGLYGISDTRELNALFATLVFHTGQEVSLDGLSQHSQVARNTLKKHLEYLEAAFLVKIVRRIDENARRFRRMNFFKVYATNPSLRTALYGPLQEDDPLMGCLVETGVLAQWFHSSFTPYYARWRAGEVDLVFLDPMGRPEWAQEIKWSDRCVDSRDELLPLLEFMAKHGLNYGGITTRTRPAPGTSGAMRRIDQRTVVFMKPSSYECLRIGAMMFEQSSGTETLRRRMLFNDADEDVP